MKYNYILLTLTIIFLILVRLASAQVSFTKIIVDTTFAVNSWPFDLNAADLNGDNEIDLVVSCQDVYTGENSVVLWYQNDGSENFAKNIIEAPIFEVRTFDVGDLDGDLDNDIILAASSKISLYDNDGNGIFQKIIIDNLGNPKAPIITDLDGDLDNDIVLSNHQGIFWEKNEGYQSFTRDTVEVVASYDMGLYVSDLDDDLDNDVVTQIHIESASTDLLVWYKNDGDENFTREVIDSSIQNIRQIIIDDLDRDNDQDIIAIDLRNTGDAILWYQNDGNESFIRDTISVNFDKFPQSIAIADIDNDGDMDVLATGGNSAIGEVVYYENDSNENFAKHVLDNSPGNRQRIFAIDIENDGDLDLFVTNNFPFELVYYRNDGMSKIKNELKPNSPLAFTLEQNYPNPFNSHTTIKFVLPQPELVSLKIYNIAGQEVTTLVHENLPAGHYKYRCDAGTFANGVYHYSLRAGEYKQTRKFVLIK